MKTILLSTFIALAALLISGCSKPAENASGSYEVKGYVERVENDGARVIVDHEEIPGFMHAMVMAFDVKTPAEAAKLAPGDQIQFTLAQENKLFVISNIRKTGQTRAAKPGADHGHSH